MGQHLIVLNSVDMAIDLLEKRSAIYSDRPKIPWPHCNQIVFLEHTLSNTCSSRMGWGRTTAFLSYGDELRQHRRILHQRYRAEAVLSLHPLLLRTVHQLLQSLSESDKDFAKQLRS